MVEKAEALLLTMSADIKQMERAYQRAQKQTDATTRAIERRFDQMNDRVVRSGEDMGDGLNRAIASIGIGYAVRELGQYADAWTNLRNTVRQYEAVLGPVDAASARLVSISNDAGVAVDALGSVFGGAARSAQKFGYDGERVFEFMEAVSKGAAIANTGVAAVDGAMRQLSQSIGSPTVQLGEFNSIIEGTPRLAQAFADGIKEANGDVSELRRLISSGEISGQELFGGLLSQLGRIRSEFAGVDTTIGRAITTLQNAAIEYVGSVDQSLGASRKLAGVIGIVAENLDLLAAAAVATAVVLGGRGLTQSFLQAAIAGQKMGASLGEAAKKGAEEARRAAVAATGEAARLNRILNEEIDTLQRLSGATDKRRAALEASSKAQVYRTAAEQKALLELAAAQRALDEAEVSGNYERRQLALRRQSEAVYAMSEANATYRKNLTALIASESEYSRQQGKVTSLTIQHAEAQATANAMAYKGSGAYRSLAGGMAALNSFLASPIGAIALIGALTFALQTLGREAPKAAEKVEEARRLLDKAAAARSSIETDTARIKTINEGLTEAILAQGDAARSTADLEIAAINERIAKNRELEQVYKDRATADLAEARRRRGTEQQQQGRILAQIAGRAPLGDVRQLGSLGTGGLIDAATREAQRAVRAGERISRDQQRLLEIVADQKELDAEIRSLEDIVEGRGQGDASKTPPVSSAGGEATKSSLNRYQTDLERLNETLAEIGKAKDTDANKSRAALRAMLDFAGAADNLTTALEGVPGLADLLTSEDAQLLNGELRKMVSDVTSSVLDGEDRIMADLKARLEDIDRARSAALAAGETDVRRFMAAIQKAFRDADAAIADLYDAERPGADVNGLIDVGDTPTFEDSPEIIQLKEDIGEAVKDGFRQGLEDDNWGEALRGLLASAMTSALDDTLTEVGNWLGDLIVQLGQASVDSGFWTSLANGVGSFFGGGRAAGGPVSAGGAYRVNESGRGEFLFMGNNAGQVLTAAQINGLTAGGGRGGGGVTINAGLTVQGSIDAASWPMVQQAMAAQERRIAQQVPGMIDKRVIDGKRNRQGGYR